MARYVSRSATRRKIADRALVFGGIGLTVLIVLAVILSGR